MSLSNKQLRVLKSMVHHLNPVVMVGQHGLTDAVVAEVDAALEAHELIKVRITGAEREEKKEMITEICERTGAVLVHLIGHVAALYRRHPDKPKIELPKK